MNSFIMNLGRLKEFDKEACLCSQRTASGDYFKRVQRVLLERM